MLEKARPEAIRYATIPCVDGKYFYCSAYHATLSTQTCTKRYLSANQFHEYFYLCGGCPIGAKHAGEAKQRICGKQKLRASFICSRCHEPSWRAAVKDRNLCVTCWNREREVLVGRNRKGCPPVVKNRFWDIDPPPDKPERCAKVYTVYFIVNFKVISKKTADTLEAMMEVFRKPDVTMCRMVWRKLPGQSSMLPGG